MGKHVAIVGGGIAGLSAALELLRHDCTVTVLEAKDRFGGRIHTVRESGLPIELGAEFIHGKSKPLLDAIHDAHLSIHEVPRRNQLFEDGRFQDVDIWEIAGDFLSRIPARERDQSFRQFLDQQNPSATDRKLLIGFVEGFNAAHMDRISAHALLFAEHSAEEIEGDWQGRIEEGYGALVSFLEAEIRAHGGALAKNTLVRSIRWKPGSVEIAAHRNGTRELFPAEATIITLPLGVWKTRAVIFEPPIPEHQEAADQLEFGNVVKIILVFREPCWPEKDFGFIHTLDAAIPTWWSDPRGSLITGWAGGPKADALRTRSPAELETLALDILEPIFGRALRENLVTSHVHNWANDPEIRGAYSYIPVNGLDLPKVLAAPVCDTLFFAGEATVNDAQMGTVFGALSSGLRAADEVLADGHHAHGHRGVTSDTVQSRRRRKETLTGCSKPDLI